MEKRRFSRFKFNKPATLNIQPVGHTPMRQDLTVQIVDLSLKGVLLSAKNHALQQIQPTDVIELVITLEDNISEIKMLLKLAHLNGEQGGFYCEKTDIDSITHLRRIAELNQADPQSLERELEALFTC